MRLLVIEDDRHLAAALSDGLQHEGFAVDVAYNGNDGLWMATEHVYDVIVSDLMLPGMSGFRLCERLRAAQNWTPILILTAKEGDLDEAEALDTGADDYLTKPFAFVVLVARIRALLRRGRTERPAVLTSGDLSLDPAEHTCRRGKVLIELTAREFAIVEYLMHRAGEAIAKTEILAHVWDAHYDGDQNVVEVYISLLRRKIDQPFNRHSIETVRGAGYRINGDA